MKLFAIGDLHLGFQMDKPMDVFGEHWHNHFIKIKRNWVNRVTDEDTVLIAGDTSWAMRLEEALIDLEWIDALPGKKILVKGNHDYWWKSISQLQDRYPTLSFLQNNYFTFKDMAICGARGWMFENSDGFTEEDRKIYLREVMRLERSLKTAYKDGYRQMIVMMHYPPLTKDTLVTQFTGILKDYPVRDVIYGHLHDIDSWNRAVIGPKDGINYHLVACDYMDFKLKEIYSEEVNQRKG